MFGFGKTVSVRLDRDLLRPADVTLQIPDLKKFIAHTGWQPRYDVSESIDHLLQHWRRQAALEAAAKKTR